LDLGKFEEFLATFQATPKLLNKAQVFRIFREAGGNSTETPLPDITFPQFIEAIGRCCFVAFAKVRSCIGLLFFYWFIRGAAFASRLRRCGEGEKERGRRGGRRGGRERMCVRICTEPREVPGGVCVGGVPRCVVVGGGDFGGPPGWGGGGGGGGGGAPPPPTARFCALVFLVLRSGDRLRLPLVWLWLLDRRVPPLLRLCSPRRSLERDRDRRVGCQPPANVLGQV
jgi:hypothetical protein